MAESLSSPVPTVRIPPPPPSLTPLRSPKRRQQLPVDQDPLLGKLSPEAILDALAAINAVTTHERQAKDLLTRSISQVSAEDQALGARAALAAKRLREWLKEIQQWPWPKGPAIQHGKGFISPTSDTTDDPTDFWGSLPAQLVLEYEARLEEIRDGLESLNVDELKEHIMNVHVPGRSRPSSSNSALSSISAPPFTYLQLSDFAAVITATILRALPTLTRLNMLLDTWSVRLLVLRQIPGLLSSLKIARASLNSALLSLQYSYQDKRQSITDFTSRRETLVELIGAAGSRMDTILDALEGREDSIPDAWIDSMDALETDFTTWVQRAESVAIERVWESSEPAAIGRATADNDQSQSDDAGMKPRAQDALKGVVVEDKSRDDTLSTSHERFSLELDVNPAVQSIDIKLDDRSVSGVVSINHLSATSTEAISRSLSESEIIPNVTPHVDENAARAATSTQQPQPSLVKTFTDPSNIITPSATTIDQGEETMHDSLMSASKLETSQKRNMGSVSGSSNHENELMTPFDVGDASLTLETIKNLSSEEETERQHSLKKGEQSEQSSTRLVESLPLAIFDDSKFEPVSKLQVEIEPDTVSSVPEATTFDQKEWLPLDSPPNNTEELSARQNTEDTEILPDKILEIIKTKSIESIGTGDDASNLEVKPTAQLATRTGLVSKSSEGGILKQNLAQTEEESGINVLKDASISPSRRPQSEVLEPAMTLSPKAVDITVEQIAESPLTNPSSEKLVAASQHFGPPPQQSVPQHPDIPIQSIESPMEQGLHYDPRQAHIRTVSGQSRTPSLGTEDHSTVHLSPGVFSSASDRTIRATVSPPLSSSVLQDLQAFKHNKNASLPLQRFIDDKSDVNYSINHNMHSASSSSREDLSDSSQYLREGTEGSTFRHGSESPPPSAIPRRAMRGPSSSLMRGTISSLNKVVGATKGDQPDLLRYQASSERLHSRSRLGSPYEGDSDSTLWRRKSSSTDLLQAPQPHLQNQPSMESISSYVSSNGTGEMRRRYSFSTDGGSFAIRPVNEADSDLQEKIHSILTSIPGKIRLSNRPASDNDQQSVVSSISSSKRPRIKAQSPFSTPSRAGTPTQSEGFSLSSKQRRTSSYKSEDKTVRVYHLHHRGKTEPTKLFVRTVGEDGERVMVRVGGGWADLGEYLREYVLHHGHQTPSNSNVEVKGIPAASTSPGSTTSGAATVTIQTSPGATPSISNRPSSSLSVRKIRQTSKPSELPELTFDDDEDTVDKLPLPSIPLGRRTSVSSLNSVSVSSVLGDGSSVYSPHPGSARTPHNHATPLGLAGPKPRTRHVSMTPESEAWVENVVGKARRSSSNIKPTTKPHDPRLDREMHNSSRMSMRNVSDYSTVGRNKRVVLKGLGAPEPF